jgi:hydroxymethylpyrimidine/phosphomethylpyrimidine kinase
MERLSRRRSPSGFSVTGVTPPVVLTINASDSGGGSGIQADLKTFAALRVYGASVVTAVSAQNSRRSIDVFHMPANTVSGQLAAVLDDLPVAAVKTGMFPSADAVTAIMQRAKAGVLPNLVVDPVLVDTGAKSRRAVVGALERLLPYALVVTPNREEASALLGWQVATPTEMARAARQLVSGGPRHVVVTGGDMVIGSEATDAVWAAGAERFMSAPRVLSRNSRGSGDVFSAAIAARLALGDSETEAMGFAKGLVARAIADAADWKMGAGPGPIDVCGWSSPVR